MKKFLFLFLMFFTQDVFAYSENYGETFLNTFFAALIVGLFFYLVVFVVEKLLIQTTQGTKYVRKEN